MEMSPEFCKKSSDAHLGQIAWNKGKTDIYTKEALEKMSEGHKGKPTWNKGKPRTWYTSGFIDHTHTHETKI